MNKRQRKKLLRKICQKFYIPFCGVIEQIPCLVIEQTPFMRQKFWVTTKGTGMFKIEVDKIA